MHTEMTGAMPGLRDYSSCPLWHASLSSLRRGESKQNISAVLICCLQAYTLALRHLCSLIGAGSPKHQLLLPQSPVSHHTFYQHK